MAQYLYVYHASVTLGTDFFEAHAQLYGTTYKLLPYYSWYLMAYFEHVSQRKSNEQRKATETLLNHSVTIHFAHLCSCISDSSTWGLGSCAKVLLVAIL